ncbi:hypothetical protein OG883_13165 [Streptomyces sp. NBC_01142]|uniref:anti-sigma factor family protein n=1 Tax=Streptomyces sp. NBC_01142 TaxID=2975865 RepID=UPI0022556D07|nr:hypothetical protein [Streptomyces sp. NBC_01142]MCX4820840.1 hypothetical protein [Streptomyces sp. NBC_01142]
MNLQQRHRDVAAYALGVLEPADAFRFEEHLTDCVMCAVQLADFTAVTAALTELAGPGRAEPRPTPRLLERLTDEVGALRRRSRRRRLRLVAAAAALIIALPAAAVALQDGGSAGGQQIVATDLASGVTASVALRERGWGTAVALQLAGLTGPRVCRLIAIGKDGAEHPVLSWAVPDGGYGMPDSPGHEQPLDIEGGTGLQSAEIGHWEIRTGDGKRLVSIGG